MTNPAPEAPKFDPNAAHQQKPKLRPVRGFPAQFGNQMALGLADARQISEKVVFTVPAAQFILPLMNGERTMDEIVQSVGRGLTRESLEHLVAQLDDAGLLFGPTFEAMVAKMRADFDASPVLPPATTAAMIDGIAQHEAGEGFAQMTQEAKTELGAKKLRSVMDEWMSAALKDAARPSLDGLPKAIVAPHLDYQRGWLNYSATYGRMRVVDRPDRVVILGTNHFGESTGVCGCDKGYETAFGVCEIDQQLLESLKANLGSEDSAKLFKNRFDHEREHSIELQIPWIQHVFGPDEHGKFPRVFGALVHDPSVNEGQSYDGNGLGLDPFVNAMCRTLDALPGKTLIVSSADLSHVGPAFGPTYGFNGPLAGEAGEAAEARNQVFAHDREMVTLLAENKPEELLAAMAWQQNPTRWCSVGNLVATMRIARPSKVELFNYAAAMDPEGTTMVSSVSMAMS
ncbi:MAG: AmmeMemoRadiSam system protein B [Phycisphaerales bacterium]